MRVLTLFGAVLYGNVFVAESEGPPVAPSNSQAPGPSQP
jgi:hypothetical protein